MHATVISAFGIVYLLFLFLGHLSAQITVSPSTFNPLMVDSKPEPATKNSWHINNYYPKRWLINMNSSDKKLRQSYDYRPLHNPLYG
uniref:GEO12415p1 n=1 Tax=Drosophila melanogaster TaxID=7227 RepID=Q86P02_DROME|eukprot:NP_001262958.1 uncharacterized protein Dmel_CG33494, isoform B [Drosophila melanogaster]